MRPAGTDSLAPCPSSPNCVCSDDEGRLHTIAPLVLDVPPDEAWPVVVHVVAEMNRSTVVVEDADYLHAEFKSALLGFVDDLELHLREGDGVIAVRSASRLGWSDMGVNRRRIESLRKALVERGVAH